MKCKNCKEEIIKSSEFCPFCGKKNIGKYNQIFLEESHYRNLRDNPDYYKCESCGSINSIKSTRCLNCSAPNKKIPKEREKKKTPQIFNFFLNPAQTEKTEEKEKPKIEKKVPVVISVWGRLPKILKLFVMGATMLGVGSVVPTEWWQGLLAGGLQLGGIGIIILAFSTLAPPKKKGKEK